METGLRRLRIHIAVEYNVYVVQITGQKVWGGKKNFWLAPLAKIVSPPLSKPWRRPWDKEMHNVV